MKLFPLRKQPWSIPGFLVISTLFALVAALAGDGFWDDLSWLLLVTPIIIILGALIHRPNLRREK